MITDYHKRRIPALGLAALLLLLALTFTTYAKPTQHTPIASDKAELMGRVEDFFLHNFRDVTLRKSLEWGDVKTDSKGHRYIRYKYEATIWGKDKIIQHRPLMKDFSPAWNKKHKVHTGRLELEAEPGTVQYILKVQSTKPLSPRRPGLTCDDSSFVTPQSMVAG